MSLNIAQHSAIWRTYMAHNHVVWFKTSQKSAGLVMCRSFVNYFSEILHSGEWMKYFIQELLVLSTSSSFCSLFQYFKLVRDDYVDIIDHRKSIIYLGILKNNLKIDYFLSINRFYCKFSYNSLFCSASSCCSHFGATSCRLFALGGIGSIPCDVMYIFFQIFDNFPTKIVILFCKNRQMFLQKLSNFLTKMINIIFF